MRKVLISIYDEKSELFSDPRPTNTTGDAVRSFTDLVNDDKTMPSRHPEDFKLYQLGSWDDHTGAIELFDIPKLIISASQVVITQS